ncbi:hypothetical protein R3P38DRAFT_1407754 [Favolaschia claudopus]|uniref:Uncharacterized protein n=1 Tax=Favolaschia claudopus TaxID=2862362 RepID=A0AAW0ARM8_9AGAR
MSPSPTFCDIPLSATFNADFEDSAVSSDWLQRNGINCSETEASGVLSLTCHDTTCKMKVYLNIMDFLPSDLVLGRDWHLFCRDSFPGARFFLTSGVLDFAPATTCLRPFLLH